MPLMITFHAFTSSCLSLLSGCWWLYYKEKSWTITEALRSYLWHFLWESEKLGEVYHLQLMVWTVFWDPLFSNSNLVGLKHRDLSYWELTPYTSKLHDLSISKILTIALKIHTVCTCFRLIPLTTFFFFLLHAFLWTSWFLLLYLRFNAAVVFTDLSHDWLHHGLENEGVWGGKCKCTSKEKVWGRFSGFSLG